ncbi:MAG: DUF2752 domain-containing protein [Armatimonadetes bacterium]|nr:DUF2752 domain-containing protein [Armatimonadota bacterium]
MGQGEELSHRKNVRVNSLWWAAAAAAVVLAAHVVEPDVRGYGTHTHVLPVECLFRRITHLPCPGCGLTTSFALAARGQWKEALRTHYLGPAAYLATWVLFFWGIFAALGALRAPSEVLGRTWVIVAIAALMIAAWALRIAIALAGPPR